MNYHAQQLGVQDKGPCALLPLMLGNFVKIYIPPRNKYLALLLY